MDSLPSTSDEMMPQNKSSENTHVFTSSDSPANDAETIPQQQQNHAMSTTFVDERTTSTAATTSANTSSSNNNNTNHQITSSLANAPRFPSSASLTNLVAHQQQQQQQQASYYSNVPVEHLRTLDCHTVLRGKRDSTEGFVRGEGGSINIRPVLSQDDHEIMEDKVQLVEKCCSVAASIALEDAFERPQSVFTVKNKKQQKEIVAFISGGSSNGNGGGNYNGNNNNNNTNSYNNNSGGNATGGGAGAGGGGTSMMMNMTSAILSSGAGYSSGNNSTQHLMGPLGPSNAVSNAGGHFGANNGNLSNALNRKHLRGDKWRWVLQRFQHSCPRCGGPAVDYVLVVTTHTNTSSPRVTGVLFTDSFPCVNSVHRHFAETHEVFRKQEAVLHDFQGKLASLISHTDMFVSFDVMKLRDDVVAPYWLQLLVTRNLRAPCQLSESNALGMPTSQHLHHHPPPNAQISFSASITERTNTVGTINLASVMSPGTILPPSTHQLQDNSANLIAPSNNNNTITGISSDTATTTDDNSPGSLGTANTAPSLNNTNNNSKFPSTPGHHQQNQLPILAHHAASASLAPIAVPPLPSAAPVQTYNFGGMSTIANNNNNNNNNAQQQQQQQQQRGIDASTVYNSIKALHIILSYRSVVLLGSNASKSMIRGWLDFFRAIYDPSRVVLPDPIQVPPLASATGTNAAALAATGTMRMATTGNFSDTVSLGGTSAVSHYNPNNINASETSSNVSYQTAGMNSIPPTPNVTSSSNNNNNSNVPSIISLFNQKKFNWLPLPHVAAQAFCSNSVDHDLIPALRKLSEEDFERDPMQVPCVCIVEEGTGLLMIPSMQIYSSNEERMMVIEATESSKLMTTLRQILLDIGTEQEYRQMINDAGKMARERIMLATQRSKINVNNNNNNNNNNSSKKAASPGATTSNSTGGGFFNSLFNRNKAGSENPNATTNNNNKSNTNSTYQDPHFTSSVSDDGLVSHDLATLLDGGVVLSGLSTNNDNDENMSDVNSVSAMTVASTAYRHKSLLNRNCCESMLFRSASFWATWSRRYSHLPHKWDLTFIGLGSDRDAPYWIEKRKVALIEHQLRM